MNKFLAILAVNLAICGNLFGAWVMFNDGTDTYIYNNLNGDIFVRHRGDGENYEDRFIKMPAGVIPSNLQTNQMRKNSVNQSANPSNLNANRGANSNVNPSNPSNLGAIQTNPSNPNATNQSVQNSKDSITKEQVDAMQRRFQELESNLLNKALE